MKRLLLTILLAVASANASVNIVLDAGGAADGSGQSLEDLSTGGETIGAATGVFSFTAEADYAAGSGGALRWNDNEFDYDGGATNKTAIWTFGGLTPGEEWEVYTSWGVYQDNRSTQAPYTVQGVEVLMNQQNDTPADLVLTDTTAREINFASLGPATVDASGNVVVTLSSDPFGIPGNTSWVIADAVVLRMANTNAAPPVWNENPVTGLPGTVGLSYSDTLAGKASDANDDPITYSRDPAGPSWLDVGSDGALSGTPSTPGTNTFTVIATADDGATAATLNIVVSDPAPPVWNEDPITGASAILGTPYIGTLAGQATDPEGGPVTYSRDPGGPPWLEVASDGALSGTPTATGINTFTVLATDPDGDTPATLNILVEELTDGVLISTTRGNGSFEDPIVASPLNINSGTVPYWSIWSEMAGAEGDTGIYVTESATDGSQLCYIEPSGAIANMTTYIIQEGDVINYSVDHALAGRDPATLSLVWADGGSVAEIAGTAVIASNGVSAVGQYTVLPGDAAIGSALGVGIVSGGSWPEVDNVQLSFVPKPANAVTDLRITGPVSGGTQMVLSWTSENNGSYGVETNSNLIIGNWQPFRSGIDGDGGTLYVTNIVGPNQTFYRIITE